MRIATASNDEARVWLLTLDDRQSSLISTFESDPKNEILSVAFSPDARILAVPNGMSAAVYIWDISKSCVLAKLVHEKRINYVSFANAHEIYTGGDDRTIKRWRLLEGRKSEISMTSFTGMCIQTFTGHQVRLISLNFTICSPRLTHFYHTSRVLFGPWR